jgi:hypothetical protein
VVWAFSLAVVRSEGSIEMRNFSIKAAIAAAVLASAGSALAATPAADHFLRVGGATATNGVLFDVFVNTQAGVCGSDIDVYTNGATAVTASVKGNQQVMVTCVAKSNLGPAYGAINGSAIGYNKESNGGSGNGTGALANQTNLAFLNQAAPNCAQTVAMPAAAGLQAYTLHTGCVGLVNQAPEIGIADVEGSLLGYTGSNLSAQPLLDIVFGVPVSLPLYRALQDAQGLATNDSCDSVPSLTRGQIAGLYTGSTSDASILSLDSKPVHICRRGDSSGTQAGAKAYFLGEGCTANVAPFAFPDNPAQKAGGVTWASSTGVSQGVFAGSGGGEVQSCLTAFANNSGDDFAIGVLSTENAPLTTADASRNGYRFVKVDGAMPTLQGTANGAYQYFTSNVLNTRNDAAYSAAETALYAYISSVSGNPQVLAPVNQPYQNGVCQASGTTFGDGGVLASSSFIDANNGELPAGYAPPFTGQMVRNEALNTHSRQPRNQINNCQTPIPHQAVGVQVSGGK